jgi:hypothetical protein
LPLQISAGAYSTRQGAFKLTKQVSRVQIIPILTSFTMLWRRSRYTCKLPLLASTNQSFRVFRGAQKIEFIPELKMKYDYLYLIVLR